MEQARRDEDEGKLGPDQGGGPPLGTAWTLVVTGEPEWSADLEHAAPLPRVGERIEYIAADGSRRDYVVREVVHTLQPAASVRPEVRAEVRAEGASPSESHMLRAGLPRVIVEPIA